MPLLIEPEMLATLLHDDKMVLLDSRFSLASHREGRILYDQGHIPGAVYADLEEDLSGQIIPGKTGRHPLPDKDAFTQTLRRWGIKNESQVVIYDDGGHAMAARAWWLLRWAGIKQVCVLHGGVKAWQAGRYPMTTAQPDIHSSSIIPEFNAMPVITAAEVYEQLGSGQYTLIDARGLERFRGDVEPLDSKAGHIPGAVSHAFSGNMDEQGCFLSPEYLKKQFQSQIRSNTTPVFYCGSGVTACHNILAMEYAGLEGGVLYAGSWSDWITHPDYPVALGD